jgi:hypothetical protein
MIKLFSMLLMSLISTSCATFVPKLPTVKVERCVVVLSTPQSPNGWCGCAPYEISHQIIGPVGPAVVKPLGYCDRFVGFHPKDGWVPLLETLEEAYQAVEDAGASFTPPKRETPEQVLEFAYGK